MFKLYTQKDVDRIVTDKLSEYDKERNMREMYSHEIETQHRRFDFIEKRIVKLEDALNLKDREAC